VEALQGSEGTESGQSRVQRVRTALRREQRGEAKDGRKGIYGMSDCVHGLSVGFARRQNYKSNILFYSKRAQRGVLQV